MGIDSGLRTSLVLSQSPAIGAHPSIYNILGQEPLAQEVRFIHSNPFKKNKQITTKVNNMNLDSYLYIFFFYSGFEIHPISFGADNVLFLIHLPCKATPYVKNEKLDAASLCASTLAGLRTKRKFKL